MPAGRLRIIWFGSLLIHGCASERATLKADELAPSDASFVLDRASLTAEGASPSLIAQIEISAYAYFRMLRPAFIRWTCHDFRDLRPRLPLVAVHGDAHVAQFVVTRDAYGLEDFDHAGFGPSIVDLVRYAVNRDRRGKDGGSLRTGTTPIAIASTMPRRRPDSFGLRRVIIGRGHRAGRSTIDSRKKAPVSRVS